MEHKLKYFHFALIILFASCNLESEKNRGHQTAINYKEIDKKRLSGEWFFSLEVPEWISAGVQSQFPVEIKTNFSGPFLVGVNNQYQYTTPQKSSKIPIKLSKGEYLLMATIVDADGNTFQNNIYDVNRIATESQRKSIDETKPQIWVNYVRKMEDKVEVDYLVLNINREESPTVRIYLNDRYLLEQKVPKRITISGLEVGTHKIRFEITDKEGNLLDSSFARVESKFVL